MHMPTDFGKLDILHAHVHVYTYSYKLVIRCSGAITMKYLN